LGNEEQKTNPLFFQEKDETDNQQWGNTFGGGNYFNAFAGGLGGDVSSGQEELFA